MGLAVEEQETSISYMRNSDVCRIYTSDTTVMTKLDKLVRSDKAPQWKLVQEHYLKNGILVAKTYETDKRLISYRKDFGSNNISEEVREARAEHMRKYRKSQKDSNEVTVHC